MKHSKWVRFLPTKEIWVVLLSWIAVVSVFFIAFNIFTTRMVAANFISFGIVGIMICGVLTPVVWNCLVMKRPFSDIGISRKRLLPSIIIGLVLTVVQYSLTIKNVQIPMLSDLVPLLMMVLCVGLYESVFYRGWVQLRMEEYFGIIPAIVLSAIIYSLYHIGYGMPFEEIRFLFFLGMIYSVIFRLTKNIFILFPLLTPSGALFSNIKDGLKLPFEATYGFADLLIMLFIGLFIINKLMKKRDLKFSIIPKQPVRN